MAGLFDWLFQRGGGAQTPGASVLGPSVFGASDPARMPSIMPMPGGVTVAATQADPNIQADQLYDQLYGSERFQRDRTRNMLLGAASGLLKASGPTTIPTSIFSGIGAGIEGAQKGADDTETKQGQRLMLGAQFDTNRMNNDMRKRFMEIMTGGGTQTPGATPGGATAPGGTAGYQQTTGGSLFEIPEAHRPAVMAAAQRYGVSPEQIAALIANESGWNPGAVATGDQRGTVNPATGKPYDSVGLGQFGEQFAREHGRWQGSRAFDPRDPAQAIDAIAETLARHTQKYGGNELLGRLAYGWGPGNVDQWLASGGDINKLPDGARIWLSRSAYGMSDPAAARAAFPQLAEHLKPGARWRGGSPAAPQQTGQISAMPSATGTGGATSPTAPVRVTTPEQFAALPDGAIAIAPDGRLIVKGQQKPPTAAPTPGVDLGSVRF